MGPSQKMLWKVYAGVLGAVAVFATQKALNGAWKLATGDEPPEVNDPNTGLAEAAIWALASGVGIGLAQLLTNRYAARHWESHIGQQAPLKQKLKFNLH